MNTTTEPIADRIELLVDGELPEAERAGLFSEIEATPGGWRRCALAYAEVQVISDSFDGGRTVGGTPVRRWWRMGGMAAALAAAFLAGRMIDRAEAAPVLAVADGAVDLPPVALAGRPELFRSAETEEGAPAYMTLEPLPAFMLEALVAAGHRVRLTEHKVQLDAPDGEEIELPLVETQIIDMRPMAL